MKAKRLLTAVLAVLMLLSSFTVLAAGGSAPDFQISVEADKDVYNPGDVAIVTVWLDRNDASDPYYLYNFQDFFIYDGSVLSLRSIDVKARDFNATDPEPYDATLPQYLQSTIRYQYTDVNTPPRRDAALIVAVYTFDVISNSTVRFFHDNVMVWTEAGGTDHAVIQGGSVTDPGGVFPVEDFYTLSYDAEPGGTVTAYGVAYGTGIPSGTALPVYTHVKLTATANPYSVFTGWDDGVTTPNRQFYMDGDVALTAQFARTHAQVNFGAAVGGTVDGTVSVAGGTPAAISSGDYQPLGSAITLTASPNMDYVFDQWDDGDTNPVRVIDPLTDDVNLSASFTYVPPYYPPVTPEKTWDGKVPLTGDKGTAMIDAAKDGKNVDTAPIKASDLSKAGTGDDLSLDVSDFLPKAESVTLPEESVRRVGNSPADALELVLPAGTVTPDNDALDAIDPQLNGKPIKFVLKEIPEEEERIKADPRNDALLHNPKVYDAYLECDGKKITDFGNGEITVGVPYSSSTDIRVFAVDDAGNTRVIPDRQDKGFTYFPLQSESRYIIADLASGQAGCPQDDTCPYAKFPDADPQAWYHGGVHYCVEEGLMIGYDDGKFYPFASLTRAQLVMILWRIEGSPAFSASGSVFSDVKADDWFAVQVNWAAANGVVLGYDNGKFGPNDPITREQLATIFFRYAKMKGYNTEGRVDLSKYSDYSLVSGYAKEALSWAAFAQIINQRGSGYMAPREDAMRCEAAFMIQQYRESVCVKVR